MIAGYDRERESSATSYVKRGAIIVQAYYRPVGFQEAEAPRFLASRHMKVVSPSHWPPLLPRKYSWYPFLLEDDTSDVLA